MTSEFYRRQSALKDRIRDRADEPKYNPTVSEVAGQLKKVRRLKELLGEKASSLKIVYLSDSPTTGRLHTSVGIFAVTDQTTVEEMMAFFA